MKWRRVCLFFVGLVLLGVGIAGYFLDLTGYGWWIASGLFVTFENA